MSRNIKFNLFLGSSFTIYGVADLLLTRTIPSIIFILLGLIFLSSLIKEKKIRILLQTIFMIIGLICFIFFIAHRFFTF